MPARRHNLILCTLGFAAIGLGVGAVVGTVIGSFVWRSLTLAEQAGVSPTSTVYRWMELLMPFGLLAGAFAGAAFAVLANRRKR